MNIIRSIKYKTLGKIITNKKSRPNRNIFYYLEILLLLLLILIIIRYISNIFNTLNMCIISNTDTILSIKDAKGTLEINNIKIEGLEPQIDKLRDGGLYIAGLAAGARIVKNSSIPLAAKLGTTVALGAASLIGFRIAQNSLKPNIHTDKITTTIDKVNSSITTSNNCKSNFINNLTNESNNSNDNYNVISSLDIEQLQLIFYLDLLIIYLLTMVIVFLLMKQISTLNLKFDFALKLPYGNLVQNLAIKIFKL